MKKLPTAFIWDIDGVICDSFQEEFIKQFADGDFTMFERNIPNYPANRWATAMVNTLSLEHRIIFVTARDEAYREETIKWLTRELDTKYLCSADLYMRPVGDRRSDDIIKKELFEKFKDSFNILCALDDRHDNCRLWQSLGIPALTNTIPKEE